MEEQQVYTPDESLVDLADSQAEVSQRAKQEEDNAITQETDRSIAADQAADPRSDGVGFNAGDIGSELSAAIGGGLQDTASSVATLPERAMDMVSGEMAEEGENYRPEWDPFTDHDNPIETKTWWGGAIRGLVHFGGMAVGTVVAAKGIAALGVGAGISAGAGWLAGAGKAATLGGNLARGAVIGGVGDVISRQSQETNAMGAIAKRYPALDNPLATNDTDHPAMKTLKSVVEGMGIGLVADLAFEAVGGALKGTAQIDARNASIQEQTIARGKMEVKETTEFRGYKNKPIAETQQGNATSMGTPKAVEQQAKRIDKEWGAESGSTDSLVTAKSLKRMNDEAKNLGDADHIETRDALFKDPEIKAKVEAARVKGKPLSEVFPEAAERAKATFEGRNTSDMSPSEFFKELDARANTINGQKAWKGEDIVTADLINTSLLKEIRDFAVAGRELVDVVDITDVDGPLDAIKEKLIYSMTNINKANKLISDDFRARQASDPKAATKELVEDKLAVKESVEAMVSLIRADSSDDFLKGVMEVFSGADINTMKDYQNWLMTKLKGGQLKAGGPEKTGFLIKELGGVFTNSVLSGPKTPVRAISGTGAMSFMRPISQAAGAAMRGDTATMRVALAESNAMIQTIPEAFKIFKTRLGSYWSGEVATVNTRFSEARTRNDEVWAMMEDYVENSGKASTGDVAAFRIANIARGMNNNKYLTYSTKVMAAGDDAFNTLMMRARLRGKATREAIENGGVTPQALKEAEDRFLDQITDEAGNIDINKLKEIDPYYKEAAQEVTLTTELDGFSKGLETVMNANPWTKPFFLFARTGINGLAMTAKHTPGINLILKKQRAIFMASPDNMGPVLKYGITDPAELANAKALALGRQSIGMGVIFMAAQMHMNGNLRGSGPVDRQLRGTWTDADYKRNTVKFGETWVNYEAFEPFNQILTLVADIGDHSQLMGEQWTENKFQTLAAIIAEATTSKSYLSSLQDFVDLVSGDPKAFGRISGGLLNNTVPLSSMRNEIGKLISPHTRELNSDIWTAIRNRNQLTEGGSDQLPIKYDLLNGKSIKQQNFGTRMFNMFSPVQFNLDGSPGRDLLFRSNYDLRTSVLSYNGIDMTKNAKLRSEFQRLIGKQNVEAALDELAKDPKMIRSIQTMEADLRAGDQGNDPMKYPHNIRIKRIFDKAKKKAWAQMRMNEDVKLLIQEQKDKRAAEYQRKQEINNAPTAIELSRYPH